MNKRQLIAALSNQSGITKKQAKDIIDAFAITVKDSLSRGEKVTISGLGTFVLSKRRGYTGKNPQTGEKVEIAPIAIPYFKPSKIFKESIK